MDNSIVPSYDDFYKDHYDQNQKDLVQQIYISDILCIKTEEKIKNYAKRYFCTFDEVLQAIKDDPVFARQFAKDPKKQNIGEKYTLCVLKHCFDCRLIDEYKKLGVKEMWAYNDHINNKSPRKGSAKSIDFYVRCGKNHYYIVQKRNDGQGGAQSSAKNEIYSVLDSVRDLDKSEGIMMAVLDGTQYTDEVMSDMSEKYRRAVIIKTDQLPAYFRKSKNG